MDNYIKKGGTFTPEEIQLMPEKRKEMLGDIMYKNSSVIEKDIEKQIEEIQDKTDSLVVDQYDCNEGYDTYLQTKKSIDTTVHLKAQKLGITKMMKRDSIEEIEE